MVFWEKAWSYYLGPNGEWYTGLKLKVDILLSMSGCWTWSIFVYKNRRTTNIILIKVYSKVYSGPHQPETFIIIIIII